MHTMTHPGLPGREIEVSAEALVHYVRSGWEDAGEVTDPAPLDPADEPVVDDDNTDDGDPAGDDNEQEK
jgi:hypothetical protein